MSCLISGDVDHCRLFDIQLPRPAEKPQIKIPSKLKEALEQAKKATETRLKEDQKLVSVQIGDLPLLN